MQNKGWQQIELQKVTIDGSNWVCHENKEAFWGVIEQSDGSWAILIDCPAGFLSSDQVTLLAEIISDEGLGIKLTGRQAPILLLPQHKVAGALEKLKANGIKIGYLHKTLRNVKACIGSRGCKNAKTYDAVELARNISNKFYGVKLPWDFKIGISGCPRNCGSATCQSLGLIEEHDGFTVYLGGSENAHTQFHGKPVARGVPEEKIDDVIATVLKCYIWAAEDIRKNKLLQGHPRFYDIFKRYGEAFFIDAINTTLGQDTPVNVNIISDKADAAPTFIKALPGFNRANIFTAFMVLDKLCGHCTECKKYKCHLFIAKECLTEAARTGKKFLPDIPNDMIQLIHALPLPTDLFEQFKLHDAFHSIREVCDQCHITEHDSLCAVNIALTAIGCLIWGSKYETPKDIELRILLNK
ncbi:nitrite and sulfite reductase 4Fe-4S region [Thermincola ferriacetica]|uniref:Nitrite and sulfite reductase 4Fe-4S region n=1 Tax=Thermincola ferriacetica TaxID=281456 RepID=A0A0L6VZD2_9FIRM|nr:hypothetical protein [Thermincola ferriacetica]KNZ68571.1 nitrite and sulfite reductase 4Fe-4S region [Thermincola ferriacetica]